MSDPYSVLGVRPEASDDEIKRAYRELARKYHPDNYQNNPLADLAEEKMKEVNEAYDVINKQRASGGGYQSQRQSTHQGSYQQQTSSSGSPLYNRARQSINAGDLDTAEQLLRTAPLQDGEWHFLMGSIAYRKGWLDEATQHYQTAGKHGPRQCGVPASAGYDAQGRASISPLRLQQWGRGHLRLLYQSFMSELPVWRL